MLLLVLDLIGTFVVALAEPAPCRFRRSDQ
jgi:hypothetical protein